MIFLAYIWLSFRIFQVGFRAFSDGKEGGFEGTDGMTYPDFIYFMLSEEDKTTEISLRYWYVWIRLFPRLL